MPFEISEYEFTLPTGYLDADGMVHKQGWMRAESAADTLLAQRYPAVRDNPSYLSVVLLSRVVTKLGTVEWIDTKIIEGLFAADFAYLLDFYERINGRGAAAANANCPKCRHRFVAAAPERKSVW